MSLPAFLPFPARPLHWAHAEQLGVLLPERYLLLVSLRLLFLLSGVPASLHLQPHFSWGQTQAGAAGSRLERGLPRPRAPFGPEASCAVLRLPAGGALLACQPGSVTGRQTIDVPPSYENVLVSKKVFVEFFLCM